MSLSSKARKENKESYAAKQMTNTMGIAPELSQLAKTDQAGGPLPSESNRSNDVETGDLLPVEEQQTQIRNEDNSDTNPAAVSDDALARNDDTGLTSTKSNEERVSGADWNRDTEEIISPS